MDITNSILNPDHPLLEQFQLILKKHLQSQISKLKKEINEIETKYKNTEAEILQTGVLAYEAQQLVYGQQKTLNILSENVDTLLAAREEEEIEIEKNKKTFKEIENKLIQTKKINRNLLNEIESFNILIQQLAQSETKIDSRISVNKRIVEKIKQENETLAKRKKKQDYFLHQFSNEVWKLQSEIDTCKLQIAVKEDHLNEFERQIAIANTNITALQTELRSLTFFWNSVVVAVANRDKGLECLNGRVNKEDEEYKRKITEIDQQKIDIKKELLKNEKLSKINAKLNFHISSYKIQIDEHLEKKTITEQELYRVQSTMAQLNRDIEVCQFEINMKQIKYDSLIQNYNKMVIKKHQAEEKIFQTIEDQLVNVKYGKKVNKKLNEISDKKRNIEITLREAQSKRNSLYFQLESQKYENSQFFLLNEEIRLNLNRLEGEINTSKNETEKFEALYRKKEKKYHNLYKKLEVEQSNPHLSKTKTEVMKIVESTKSIQEIQQTIKNLQIFWLREQKNILVLSEERQEQMNTMNLLKKQILILDQKNMKINKEIEDLVKKEERIRHNINLLNNKAAVLSNHINKKTMEKTTLNKNNDILQIDYTLKLKDAELELLQIESTISEIEEEKLNLSKQLIEVNREGFEWEKQFQLAKEAILAIKESKKDGGELNAMKAEIHRMEVIYLQLKRAQEKLLKDMNHCLLRRDVWYNQMQFHQQNQKQNVDKIRINCQKKMSDLKKQLKSNKTDIKKIKKNMLCVDTKISNLKRLIENKQMEYKESDRYMTSLRKELEKAKIDRQFKFELLVFQQKKANLYNQLVKDRAPYMVYKKEEDLINEFHKQKDINSRLTKIVEDLKDNLPAIDDDLVKMLNSLEIAALCMYS